MKITKKKMKIMNYVKKFNENADHDDWADGIDWVDAMDYSATESKLFDEQHDTSIFTDILNDVFDAKFKGTYPSKNEIKRVLMDFCDESIVTSLNEWELNTLK